MNFPIELFKDDYYRIAHGPEEYARLVGEGWQIDRPANHPYKPWSSHPSQEAPKPEPSLLAKFISAAESADAEPVKRGPGRPPKLVQGE